ESSVGTQGTDADVKTFFDSLKVEPRFSVSRWLILKSSCRNALNGLTRRPGVAGSAVSVADVGVPARNPAIVPKLITPPVPPLKLLLSKRRNSTPALMDCLPRTQLTVSSYW